MFTLRSSGLVRQRLGRVVVYIVEIRYVASLSRNAVLASSCFRFWQATLSPAFQRNFKTKPPQMSPGCDVWGICWPCKFSNAGLMCSFLIVVAVDNCEIHFQS